MNQMGEKAAQLAFNFYCFKVRTSGINFSSLQLRKNDVLVRLSIGDLVGQKLVINNVPWSSTHDSTEPIRKDSTHFEANALYNVTVAAFLGIPYAESPVSQRRFKVTIFSLSKKSCILLYFRFTQ